MVEVSYAWIDYIAWNLLTIDCYSWWDTVQKDGFSPNLRDGWIKQYTNKLRNACIRYQKDYKERKEKKNQERTEKSSYLRNPYDCMGLKRLKLEIVILQVVFNGHAFSRYHHEVFVGIGSKDGNSSSLFLYI